MTPDELRSLADGAERLSDPHPALMAYTNAQVQLNALAPELARLCAELGETLHNIREDFVSPHSESGYDGDPVELMAAAALAKLAELETG